jgi:hypothetical protein
LVVAAFHAEFGTQLDDVAVRSSLTWKWFTIRVSYLLSTDNPLGRHFGYRSRLEAILEAVYTRPEE